MRSCERKSSPRDQASGEAVDTRKDDRQWREVQKNRRLGGGAGGWGSVPVELASSVARDYSYVSGSGCTMIGSKKFTRPLPSELGNVGV